MSDRERADTGGPNSASTTEIEAGYHALREDAAAFDLDSWTVLLVRGPDARSFLQGMATQDLARLGAGHAAMTLFLTEKGRPVSLAWVAVAVDRARPDASVTAGGPAGGAPGEAIRVLADEGARDVLRGHLERFRVMEEVEFEEHDGVPRLLGIAGPGRERVLADAQGVIHGAVPILGEPLSFLLVPPELPAISLPPMASPGAFEAWRLAVGLPCNGVDLDPERIATELSLEGAISGAKGCYVGQEVVARTSTRGHVRRRRVGFRFPWSGAPIPGRTEIRVDGKPAGYVTSTAPEPGTADGLGMGYLSLDAAHSDSSLPAPDRDVVAAAGDRITRLRVAPWPL